MDKLTQEQFMAILTHACRYDKLIKPHTDFPLNISIQMDLRHIEAIEQLVMKHKDTFMIQKLISLSLLSNFERICWYITVLLMSD